MDTLLISLALLLFLCGIATGAALVMLIARHKARDSTPDVTERIEAERALRESEQRFATFMDNNPATAWIKDSDGKYVYVNHTLCSEYQVSEDEVVGHTDHELLPRHIADALHANDRQVLNRGKAIQTFETISNPDGTDHIWLIYKFPLQGSTGEQLVGGLGLDVTEQKQTEQTLRESARVQRLLLSELNHRVRNNLASLMSLVDISQHRYSDTAHFAESMRNRLRTMDTVHGLLSTSQFSSIPFHRLLNSLIPAELSPRTDLRGPEVVVPVRQATALGIVLNEFLTNSQKHGALGSATGRVEVKWTVSPPTGDDESAEDASRKLHFTWREYDGPEITDQPQPGVGTSLIEGLVRSELGGSVSFEYNRHGVTHRLVAQLDREHVEAPGEP